jgi:RNA polymerase subunit RPABC4/transcription elongation factor Spt4
LSFRRSKFVANSNHLGTKEQHLNAAALRDLKISRLSSRRFLMTIGSRGWAGSGVILDPDQARDDVKPWSRMSGRVAQDMLSEINVVKKLEDHLDAPAAQVKIRCRQCQSLNEETAKFCNQCGAAI